MIYIVLIISIILYVLTVGSVRRNETNYTFLFLFIFFFIVAWSLIADQFAG